MKINRPSNQRSVSVQTSDSRPNDSYQNMPLYKNLPMGGAAILNHVEAYFKNSGISPDESLMEFLKPNITNSNIYSPAFFRKNLTEILSDLNDRIMSHPYGTGRSLPVVPILKELSQNSEAFILQLSSKQKA